MMIDEKKLLEELEILKSSIQLEEQFGEEANGKDWSNAFKTSMFFTDAEKERIDKIPNRFNREIELKIILNEKLNVDYPKPELAFWYINVWGRISSFKIEKNEKLVLKTIKESRDGKFLPNLQTISSLSKVASVVDIKNQVIYDSRVIYVLNWLIMKTGGNKFFPIPEGRSSIASDFDIGILINFKFHEISKENRYYAAFRILPRLSLVAEGAICRTNFTC